MNNSNNDILIPEKIPELERGPVWLREKRRLAREEYNSTPMPQRNIHIWRYTDPLKFVINRKNVADTSFGDNFDLVEKIEKKHLKEGHISGLVTDLGGRKIDFYGIDDLTKKGIIISTLSDAVENHNELVEKYLYQLVNNRLGKFEAMNGALWNDGIFIYIPENTKIDKPLHLLRESGLEKSAQFPRLLIITGKNAEVTIIDEYGGGSADSGDGNSYTNSAVELFGLEDSRTRYVILQRQASGSISYLTHRAQIERGASILTIPLAFGSLISKHNFGVILNGKGAESKIYGLLFGSGYQHFDNHTMHHHAASLTNSDIDFKVVLKDKALSAYTGLI
ncbi:MAG: SufD family Fe-S cluster assembly protein, partial [Candidatus Zixiibacteriota bacterium]